MSVSGYGSRTPDDFGFGPAGAADDPTQTQEAPDAAAPAEGDVQRGGEPRAFAGGDPTATMLAASLDAQVETGSSAAAAIGLTLEEIEALEAELDWLYFYRDYLIDEIENPNTDFWDVFWLEWDLTDTEYRIADIEYKLGRLEEELFAQLGGLFDDALGFWKEIFGYADEARRLTDQEIDELRKTREKRQRLLDDLRREREDRLRSDQHYVQAREAARRQLDESEKARLRSFRPSPPARTPETIAELRRALEQLHGHQAGEDRLQKLRDEMRKLRAEVPRAAGE